MRKNNRKGIRYDSNRLDIYRLHRAQHSADRLGRAHAPQKRARLLVDSFRGNERLADSVNHLLVVGFYLINIGYVALALREAVAPADLRQVLETVSRKVGVVMLVLGAMHFFNIFVFSKMRRRALLQSAPPPVPAQGRVPIAAQ
jgi:hypothetical protein